MTDAAALAKALTEIRQNVDSECPERLSHEEHMMGVIESVSRIARAALAAYRETAEPVGGGGPLKGRINDVELPIRPAVLAGPAVDAWESDQEGPAAYARQMGIEIDETVDRLNRRPAPPPAGEIEEQVDAINRAAIDRYVQMHEAIDAARARDADRYEREGEALSKAAASLASLSAEVERLRNGQTILLEDYERAVKSYANELSSANARAESAEAQVTALAGELAEAKESRDDWHKRACDDAAALATARREALEGLLADGPAFERAFGLLIRGRPVGAGDGGTFVSEVPTKERFRAAIRAMMEDR